MINFRQNFYLEEHNFAESERKQSPGDIQASGDISGVEVRLSSVLVKDNKTPRVFPFPGYAKVYFLNLIVSDLASCQLQLDLKGFEKVDDGDALNVDRTLFYWKKGAETNPPSQIHIFTSLIKSKEPLRNTAAILSEVKNDTDYKSLAGSLDKVVKHAQSVTDISNIIFSVAGIVSKYLGDVDDKPLLTWIQSFTDMNGDFDVLGKTDKKAENKYASMNLSIIIRDKARMKEENEEAATTAKPLGVNL